MDDIQFNWVRYLCSEFPSNYREAQNDSKTFHYLWIFLSIVLVTWDFLEDIQFPPLEKDILEVTKFASLWGTKYVAWVMESKVFWVLMEASIRMAINQKLQLSPTMFKNLLGYAELKVDFHNIYVQLHKNPNQKWFDLPYLATDDVISEVIKHWPTD